MNESIRANVKELAYIYHKRNMLGRERDRLRFKLKYLNDIRNSKQVKTNFEASPLFKRWSNYYASQNIPLSEKLKWMAQEKENYLKRYPIPKRYQGISLTEMHLQILEMEKKVLDSKIKIMKHTKKYDKRIKVLTKGIEFNPIYRC